MNTESATVNPEPIFSSHVRQSRMVEMGHSHAKMHRDRLYPHILPVLGRSHSSRERRQKSTTHRGRLYIFL